MSSPKIVYANLSHWNFTLSGGTSDINNPITNLQDYLQFTKWISAGLNPNQSLIIDIGAVSSFNSIIIDNHNLDVSNISPILVQTGSTSAFTSDLGTVLSISTSSIDTFYAEFPMASSRYWRIFYDGTVNATPYIANLFLCNRLSFEGTQNWNYIEDVPRHVSTNRTTLNGIYKWTQAKNNFARLYSSFTFSLQSNAIRDKFRSFVNAIRGKLYPFYYINAHDIIRYVNTENDLNQVINNRYNQHTITLELTTQNTSNNWSYVPFTNLAAIPVDQLYGIVESQELIV